MKYKPLKAWAVIFTELFDQTNTYEYICRTKKQAEEFRGSNKAEIIHIEIKQIK